MTGEQFADIEAVTRLREIRRTPPDGRLLVIGAVDPLNLAGIVTTGERVRAVASNRVVYRDGVPIAVVEGEYARPLIETEGAVPADLALVLTGRRRPAVVSGFIGRASYP
jgi:ATP-dependent Lhr-like helicase